MDEWTNNRELNLRQAYTPDMVHVSCCLPTASLLLAIIIQTVFLVA